MPSEEESSAVGDAGRLLAIAKEVAAAASDLVRSHLPHAITFKGDRDVTSDVDFAVEKLVRDILREWTPEAEFLGEEEGASSAISQDNPYWVLDPIDGTVNFIHGVPLCAVSLSLVRHGQTLVSVIDMPFLDAQYTARLGSGCYLGEQRLHVSSTDRLDAALISIDQFSFGEDSRRKNLMRHSLMRHLASRVQRIRMLGTSAVDLAWTAHGRLDACITLGNKPWDTSAGVLVAREAGARVLDLDGSDHSADSAATIAVTPALEDQLMPVLRVALAEVSAAD